MYLLFPKVCIKSIFFDGLRIYLVYFKMGENEKESKSICFGNVTHFGITDPKDA
jgi:hypothetical protein